MTVADTILELDRVVGEGRLPAWVDEMSLPYVRALIKEVHRWARREASGYHTQRLRLTSMKVVLFPTGQ